ncbi:hypothetical protein HUJ05_000872 [Dendroctonus ponderosae]|nr:hypothetical protein HUJ05_000872 [Dendroctonus ponderosae]
MPLIIRSRISDSLKHSDADLNNEDPSDANIRSSFNLNQLNTQLSLPSSYSAENVFNANNNQDVLVQNIASISELSPFLYSGNSFGVGLMSFEIKEPTIYEPTEVTQAQPSGPTRLIPAQLAYSKLFQTNIEKDEINSEDIKKTQNLQEKTSSGYIIEKVPEIASYNRTGPFQPSDIPSYDELENIFNSTPNTTVKKLDDYSQVLEPRTGIDTDDASIIENDSKLDDFTEIRITDTYDRTTTSVPEDESITTLQTLIIEEDVSLPTTNAPELSIWDILAGNSTLSLQSRSDVQTNDYTLAETETNTEAQTNGPLETTTDNFSNEYLYKDAETTTIEPNGTNSSLLLIKQIAILENIAELDNNNV